MIHQYELLLQNGYTYHERAILCRHENWDVMLVDEVLIMVYLGQIIYGHQDQLVMDQFGMLADIHLINPQALANVE